MKRKHYWFPCGVKDEPIDDWSDEDFNALMRETDWQKWITDAMWRDLMEGNGGPNLSKLKKRLAEFQVAIWRLRYLNKELMEEVDKESNRLWNKFWAIQAFGREGLQNDYTLDECIDELSKGRKEEDE